MKTTKEFFRMAKNTTVAEAVENKSISDLFLCEIVRNHPTITLGPSPLSVLAYDMGVILYDMLPDFPRRLTA